MSISPDARISLLDSFGGASASVDGIRGGVPAPSAGLGYRGTVAITGNFE